ncbi:MAG: hypothetical protein KIS72_06855, partial [Luteimonas sp.]|nr:hypothetical protein [Luteimonas sp.]
DTPVIVSLNPFTEPAEDRLIRRIEYAHPVFDHGAIEAQATLPQLQGLRHSWFAGAWTGYGFHEDGLRSAVAIATRLGVPIPWQTGAEAAASTVAPARENLREAA